MPDVVMKPILFNTEMVRAILEGRKTVTRRLVKEPYFIDTQEDVCQKSGLVMRKGTIATHGMPYPDSPYATGDILYVREMWCEAMGKPGKYFYRAYPGERDEMKEYCHALNKWSPSIHMPKTAARIFLRVKSVRVERLQKIFDSPPGPENQIVREGFKYGCDFIACWENTVPKAERDKYGYDANPWVWVIEFERCEKPRQ